MGIVLLWMLGVLASDHFLFSQWCSWIPVIILIPVGFIAGWAATSRTATILWCLVAVAATPWWFLIDQPWKPGSISREGLSLLQWTMSHDKSDRVTHAEYIIHENADITILTHGYGVRGTSEISDWLGPDVKPYKVGFFTVLTRLPVRQLRSIGAAKDIDARLIEIDTSSQLGRPLRIVAVDLPSNLLRSRMEIAHTLREWLKQRNITNVDIALGDFNMRRGSAALSSIFPELEHAWDRSGRGWGPTFGRWFPLYRIDHVLVAPWIEVLSCTTSNPGIGRHRTQRVQLGEMPESTPP